MKLDDSSSCAAFIIGQNSDSTETDSQLCNCHKFADKTIQVGCVNGYPNNLMCKWVLSADANITIAVSDLKIRLTGFPKDFFGIFRTPTDVLSSQVDEKTQVITSQIFWSFPVVPSFKVTEQDYVEIVFLAYTVVTINRGVNASWSLLSKDNLSKNGTVRCVACEAGKYLVTSDTSCLLCERGKYSPTVGATACIDCPIGSYQSSTGQTSCLSGTTYSSPADLLVVLQVLQTVDASDLRNCSARQLSLAWGLLAPEQQEQWYSGRFLRGVF